MCRRVLGISPRVPRCDFQAVAGYLVLTRVRAQPAGPLSTSIHARLTLDRTEAAPSHVSLPHPTTSRCLQKLTTQHDVLRNAPRLAPGVRPRLRIDSRRSGPREGPRRGVLPGWAPRGEVLRLLDRHDTDLGVR
eukprot:scaffold68966_cov56-Phaeocystis_antarctica.AAC.1